MGEDRGHRKCSLLALMAGAAAQGGSQATPQKEKGVNYRLLRRRRAEVKMNTEMDGRQGVECCSWSRGEEKRSSAQKPKSTLSN